MSPVISEMGSEQQAFDIGDVADAICDKLIFRHPHVFGETQAEDAEQVKQNWEDLKLKEKALEHRKKRVPAGVPRSLPALVKAYRIRREGRSGRIRLGEAGGRLGKGQGGDGRGTARDRPKRLFARGGGVRRSVFRAGQCGAFCTGSIPRRRSRKATASSSAASAYRRPGRAAGPFAPRHDARADGCAVERGQGDGKERRELAVAIAPKFLRTASDNRCRAFQSRFPCVSA